MTVVSSGVSHGSCATGRLGLHSQTTFARAVPALASDAQASTIAAAIASRPRCPAAKATPGRFELVAIYAPPPPASRRASTLLRVCLRLGGDEVDEVAQRDVGVLEVQAPCGTRR